MVDAVDTLTTDKAVRLFEKFGIFTRAELESREEILYDSYSKTINIEALTMIDMVSRKFLPAGIKYSKELADSVNSIEEAGFTPSVQSDILGKVQDKLTRMNDAMGKLKDLEKTARKIESARERAFFYKDEVVPAMADLRTPTDELELLTDKSVWPVPTYGDMLFEV